MKLKNTITEIKNTLEGIGTVLCSTRNSSPVPQHAGPAPGPTGPTANQPGLDHTDRPGEQTGKE